METEMIVPGVGLLKYRDLPVRIAVFMGQVFEGEDLMAVAMTPEDATRFVADTKRAHQALADDAVINRLEDTL